jgi:hypothetical protein
MQHFSRFQNGHLDRLQDSFHDPNIGYAAFQNVEWHATQTMAMDLPAAITNGLSSW